MAKSKEEKEAIVEGLLKRIDYEAKKQEENSEKIEHLVRILDNALNEFADEEQTSKFYENLTK